MIEFFHRQQEYYSKRAEYYQAKADKYMKKGKMEKSYKYQEKAILATAAADDMEKAGCELHEIAQSKTEFTLKYSPGKSEGKTWMDVNGVVVMEYTDDNNFSHEYKHGHQHLAGELELQKGGGVKGLHLGHEKNAYVRQYFFDPMSVKKIPSYVTWSIKNDFCDINETWVKQIKAGPKGKMGPYSDVPYSR